LPRIGLSWLVSCDWRDPWCIWGHVCCQVGQTQVARPLGRGDTRTCVWASTAVIAGEIQESRWKQRKLRRSSEVKAQPDRKPFQVGDSTAAFRGAFLIGRLARVDCAPNQKLSRGVRELVHNYGVTSEPTSCKNLRSFAWCG